jgi:PilZ domain
MARFGNSPPRGRRAAPRAQVLLIVELSIGANRFPATLLDISRTGAKLRHVGSIAAGEDVEFRAGNVQVPGEVVWCEGSECAVAFDLPIAASEVTRLQSLADMVSDLSND